MKTGISKLIRYPPGHISTVSHLYSGPRALYLHNRHINTLLALHILSIRCKSRLLVSSSLHSCSAHSSDTSAYSRQLHEDIQSLALFYNSFQSDYVVDLITEIIDIAQFLAFNQT